MSRIRVFYPPEGDITEEILEFKYRKVVLFKHKTETHFLTFGNCFAVYGIVSRLFRGHFTKETNTFSKYFRFSGFMTIYRRSGPITWP